MKHENKEQNKATKSKINIKARKYQKKKEFKTKKLI